MMIKTYNTETMLLSSNQTSFNDRQGSVKRETRFASRLPANEILSKIEAAAGPMGFNVQKRNYKVLEVKN